MTLNDLRAFCQGQDLVKTTHPTSSPAYWQWVTVSSQTHRKTTRTLSRGANMPEFCGVVLWSCWVSMFWATQKKPKAKQPSCVMSEAPMIRCIGWSVDYLCILLQNFIFRALQNFSWWKMQKCHYWMRFYTGNITALCFVIHFDPQILFGHSLWCCSYPLVLLNLEPIHDREQISWGALLKEHSPC